MSVVRRLAILALALSLMSLGGGPASAEAPPANDEISNATPVGALPFSATQDSLAATQNPADPSPTCGAPRDFTVWYSFTASADGTVVAETTNQEGFPPSPTAYTGPASATPSSALTQVACPANSTGKVQLNVTAGTTYFFMLGSYTPRHSFTFTVQAIVPPANDEIGNATQVEALPFSATQDSLNASQNQADPTPTCGAPNNYTVWYSYTPAADGTVVAETSGGDYFPPTPTAYTGPPAATPSSPLAQVKCGSPVQLNVTAGTTYYFMLGSYTPRPSFTFALRRVELPANDEISNATPVGELPFSATQDSLTATQNPADPTPTCGAPSNYTVWYSYTPVADGTIVASTSGGEGFPPTPTLYTGPAGATPSSPLTQVKCGTLQLKVTAGTTYYFMLGGSPRPSFTFTVQAVVPTANDEITNATPIGELPFSATQDSLSATQNPTDPTPTCGTSSDFTVWYSYTPAADGTIAVSTSGGDYFPPAPTVFSGPARATPSSPLNQVACGYPLQLNVTGGTTYYFMLSSPTPRPSFTFTLQAVVPTANDEITNAAPIGELPFSATQDSQYATRNAADPTPTCGSPSGFTVWYSYTPSAEGTIVASTSGGGYWTPSPTVYTGPAGATAFSPLTQVACSTTGAVLLDVNAGTTYYFMLGSYSPQPSFTFTVQVVLPTANDEISNAAPVGELPFSATQDSLTATQNPADPAPTCGAPNDYTVWYSYTPSADGTIVASTTGGGGSPPSPTVYTGPAGATPSSPLTQVACSYSPTVQLDVTAGTTYYFMLTSYSARPPFTFTVQTVAPPSIAAPPISVGTDPGQCGASVTYSNLVITGDPTPSTWVYPTSGSFFWVGTSNVSVSAYNAYGSAWTNFEVTVSDTEEPTLTGPGPVSVDATGPAGATVDYAPFTATDNCPNVTVTSTPEPGSTFAIGDTAVTGTATDQAGNRTTATFMVHVNGAAEQLAALSTAATGIGSGISLKASLDTAQKQLAYGHTKQACQATGVFITMVTVQTPRDIDPPTAQALTTDARRILAVLGC